MPDIIQQLPDHVANQIAAGEVIQRPSSAVKELIENAVDSGAKNIQLIIKEGGRSLIQIIDNGCGMSPFDARMAFSRHATSKIRKADDLWNIRTMGFRGEALASVAAVAQVELKTRLLDEEIGTLIEIEGSEIKKQESVACPPGTSISVKNLFFNVPARRNFLKSNPVETKHIFEEFQRVALAFPQISFSLHNNDQEIFRLIPGNLKQRIAGVFGSGWNEKLVSVNEETNLVKISGFIGKPEFSRKSRGEQFFFINNRFIKNNYLHHAIISAYEGLIPSDAFPAYFIFFETDPGYIDVNIHPTKTEVKFQDEKSIYAILRSAIKKSIGTFSLSPSIDFNNEPAFEIPLPSKGEIRMPEIRVNPDYNPFSKNIHKERESNVMSRISQARWDDLVISPSPETKAENTRLFHPEEATSTEKSHPWLLHGKYILSQVKSGLMFIDIQGARERILFERFLKTSSPGGRSQQLLFPVMKEFSGPDYELMVALKPELINLGYTLEPFGKHTLVINGIPSETENADVHQVLDELLEQFKTNRQNLKMNRMESLAKTLAINCAGKKSKNPGPEEMVGIIEQLFSCEIPLYSPAGRPITFMMTKEEIAAKFGMI